MHCPDCGHMLTPVPLGIHGEASQSYRCYRCGGFWLEPWLANRISTKTLDKWPQTGIARSWAGEGNDECPVHVGTELQRYVGDAVPRDVVVKRCYQCHWWWFPGNTFFTFKPAQEAKVNYYRLWNLPANLGGLMLPVAGLLILIGGAAVAVHLIVQEQYALINATGVISQFAVVYGPGGTAIVTFKSTNKISQIDYRPIGSDVWMTIPVTSNSEIYRLNLGQLLVNIQYEFRISGRIYR